MRYLSVCSGIEAATVAWHPLGWTPIGFSEIEAFPSAVLAHHYPNIPNYGDMTQHEQWPIERGAVDLLVGGTPCQSFSVAGLRKGLKDPRGGLMLTYLEIAQRLLPRWVVWENVPGVLSSNGGRDFGSFLGALGELGYGWAYRVLDAQWCRTHRHPRAVPQRRRRVFVVGCLGDRDAAAKVLFERESVQRNPAARRTPGQGTAADAETGAGAGCYWNGEQIAAALTRKGCDDRMPDKERLFAVLQPVSCVNMQGSKSNACVSQDGTAYSLNAMHGHDVHAIAIQGNLVGRDTGGPHGVGASEEGAMYTLTKADTHAVAVSVDLQNVNLGGDVAGTLDTTRPSRGGGQAVAIGTDCYNGAITGDVAATMGTPGSSVNASGPTVMQAVAFKTGNSAKARSNAESSEVTPTLGSDAGGNTIPAVAFHPLQDPISSTDGSTHCMGTGGSQGHASIAVATAMTVRRLSARECERLQGFPDDWTLIPWRGKPAEQCPDGPRYKALGNSMACNVMAWIGEKIAKWEADHA